MKRFLLIYILLITAGSLVAQTPTVADLTTTSGSNIKWYATSIGGSALATSTVLVNGTTYYASQTVNGVESATRLAVTATVAPCITAPSVTTNAVSNIGSTTATFNGNITAINGANVTTRGFKYSTTSGFDPAITGTNISESGSFSTGTFSFSPSGLTTVTTYYVRAYAINSAGTTYGSQVSFNTLIQTDFNYTGGLQTFTVPAGVTSLTIQAWGAQGGGVDGGNGGYAAGILAVTPGQVLDLYVGGQGSSTTSSAPGGYNGGGNGGLDTGGDGTGTTLWSFGGGGASDVRLSGTKVIVAGGGGGASTGGSSTSGGSGGGTNGTDAPDYQNAFGGHGGTQSGGGSPGSTLRNATYGGLGYGGNGSSGYKAWGGGGGGGGYYGGGGGSSTADHGVGYGCGGGGGSSYTGGVTSGSTTAGQRSGNGRILISY